MTKSSHPYIGLCTCALARGSCSDISVCDMDDGIKVVLIIGIVLVLLIVALAHCAFLCYHCQTQTEHVSDSEAGELGSTTQHLHPNRQHGAHSAPNSTTRTVYMMNDNGVAAGVATYTTSARNTSSREPQPRSRSSSSNTFTVTNSAGGRGASSELWLEDLSLLFNDDILPNLSGAGRGRRKGRNRTQRPRPPDNLVVEVLFEDEEQEPVHQSLPPSAAPGYSPRASTSTSHRPRPSAPPRQDTEEDLPPAYEEAVRNSPRPNRPPPVHKQMDSISYS